MHIPHKFLQTLTALLLAHSPFAGFAQNTAYRSRGYKGDVTFGLYLDGAGLTTTHGYQFNKFLFVGGGVGYECGLLPVYADVKSYFTRKELRVNPWAEVRLGVDLAGECGLFEPSVGCTLPFRNVYAMTIA